ncbi:ROK family protein [Pedobacter sp. MC2016-24]|uniref:ROK family protein n=1 Tax=Pedobacter sp. MC2016-24 TaxID=2780090 RepID=UPI00188158EA|nr:ROK family protein [Pedobacter sp. MC2016-24]MBE9602199.1 ROK family protein [Pedobacter sp. MC2016-24]
MISKVVERPVIGVDIGGSHITAAYIDATALSVVEGSLSRERVPSNDTADLIFDSWVSALKPLLDNFPFGEAKLGIAMPGPFDYTNGIGLFKDVKKYDALYGVAVGKILSERLNIALADVVFINDAVAFLTGELVAGAAVNFSRAIGITLGTGLGSSSNCSGTVVDVNRAAIPFQESKAEEYLSTRWFSKRYAELTNGGTIKNVEELLQAGDQALKDQIFDEFADNLATFINDFIEAEKPEVLVIGGNIARNWVHFMPRLQTQLKDQTVVIKQTEMWEDAALVGAASVWINE